MDDVWARVMGVLTSDIWAFSMVILPMVIWLKVCEWLFRER